MEEAIVPERSNRLVDSDEDGVRHSERQFDKHDDRTIRTKGGIRGRALAALELLIANFSFSGVTT